MNSVIVIANDRLHDITNNATRFARDLDAAINGFGCTKSNEVWHGVAKVVSVDSNHYSEIILAGENTGLRLRGAFVGSPRDINAIDRAIRELAKAYGYEVTKKPAKGKMYKEPNLACAKSRHHACQGVVAIDGGQLKLGNCPCDCHQWPKKSAKKPRPAKRSR